MKLLDSRNIPVISFLLSTIVAWIMIPIIDGFPMVPFVLFFTGLSTLIYLVRKNKSWFDTVLYIGILILSSFLLIRANEETQFITFLFILFFGSLLILPLTRENNLINLIITPLSAIFESLTGKNIFPYQWGFLKKYQKTDYIPKYLPSILVTLLFLGITIPLLASANPFFNQLTQNTLNFFNLSVLVRFISAEQILYTIPRMILLVILAYSIPRALTISKDGIIRKEINISLPINYLFPKIAMGILLVVFFITQAQLYFATPEVLRSLGYTNSRLTNEVFFQVTLVAMIIFFLAYLDKSRKSINKHLTYFLILEAFFLVSIAFKSVFDYSSLWGFTQKRLWGYATMSWLSGALLIFLHHFAKQTSNLRFFQYIITYTIVILLGVNVANFDYMIAHYSKARTQAGTDYVYLARLSPDTQYYKETLENLVTQIERSNQLEYEKVSAFYILLSKIERLQRKYTKDAPLNSFNFSEYQEYLSIQDINTQEYRKQVSDIQQKYTPTPSPRPVETIEINSSH